MYIYIYTYINYDTNMIMNDNDAILAPACLRKVRRGFCSQTLKVQEGFLVTSGRPALRLKPGTCG
jgi:hypothetical protein